MNCFSVTACKVCRSRHPSSCSPDGRRGEGAARSIDRLFALGVMGIEIPDEFGGAAEASSIPSWPSRRCRASTRRSECSSTFTTPWLSTRSCAGRAVAEPRAICRGSRRSRRRALSEAGLRSDAFALATRAGERGEGYVLTAASSGSPTATRQSSSSCSPTSIPTRVIADHRLLVERGAPGFTIGKRRTSSASAPAARAS